MRAFKGICKTVAVFLLLSGCAASAPRSSRITKRYDPVAKKHGVYQSLLHRGEWIYSLKGKSEVHFGTGVFKGKGEVVILLQEPLNFRFASFGEFGILEFDAVARGGEMTIVWYNENRYFRGIGSQEQVSQYLSIPLSPEHLIRYLLTDIPLEEEGDYRLVRRADGTVELVGERGKIVMRRNEWEYLPLHVILYGLDRSIAYQVFYEDYREEGEFSFPHRIYGRFGRSRFDVRFSDVDINPNLGNEIFEIKIPDEAERVID